MISVEYHIIHTIASVGPWVQYNKAKVCVLTVFNWRALRREYGCRGGAGMSISRQWSDCKRRRWSQMGPVLVREGSGCKEGSD